MSVRRPSGGAAVAVGSILVGLVGGTILVLVLLGGGDDPPECERIAGRPVTDMPISEVRFEDAYGGIDETRELTSEANSAPPERRQQLLNEAFETFFTRAHDLTHDFDMTLCAEDYDLATNLRESVVELEIALQAQNNPDEILRGLEEVEGLLQRAEPLVL